MQSSAAGELSRSSSDTRTASDLAEAYPLSPMQEGLLFHALCAPESDAYVYRLTIDFHGPLHADAFARAWQETVDRHAILRTRFVWDRGKRPLQSVVDQVAFEVRQLDWRAWSDPTQAEQLANVLAEDRRTAFDLTRAPLMRATLIRLSESTYKFVWTHHHLILDGWSIGVVLADMVSAYERACGHAAAAMPAPARPYRDYIDWLQRHDTTVAEAFWRRTFSPPPPLAPVTAIDRVAADSNQYHTEAACVHGDATASLTDLAREHRLTMSTIVHGVWAMLLARYSGTRDVVFGTVVSGRPAAVAGIESMAGLFINTLPMRVRLRPDEWLLKWLQELQSTAADIREHQYTPLSAIQTYAGCAAGHSLFDSVVSFDNYPLHGLRRGFGGVRVGEAADEIRSHFAVALKVVPGDELSVMLNYDAARLYRSTAHQMLKDVVTVLTRIAIQPATRLSDLIGRASPRSAGGDAASDFDEAFAFDDDGPPDD